MYRFDLNSSSNTIVYQWVDDKHTLLWNQLKFVTLCIESMKVVQDKFGNLCV